MVVELRDVVELEGLPGEVAVYDGGEDAVNQLDGLLGQGAVFRRETVEHGADLFSRGLAEPRLHMGDHVVEVEDQDIRTLTGMGQLAGSLFSMTNG